MEMIVAKQRDFFLSQQTKPYAFRLKQLQKLKEMVQTYEKAVYVVLGEDLNKSKHEVLMTELSIIYNEIDFARKHLKDWMKDEVVNAPLTHVGTNNFIRSEPYGVSFIVSPWNYPLQLSLVPAIGAIAAGNTVILKPSELAPNSSYLLKEMVAHTFDDHYFTVVEGDKTVTSAIMKQQVDYLFFTGSTNVGKKMMKQASASLTPMTLELGGKSPTIIDEDCHIRFSAKRIVWGKFMNAGQTCVAPDYLYVHESIKDKVVKQIKKQIRKQYGKKPLQNNKYSRIINETHFHRLIDLIHQENVTYGGKYNEQQLKIEPTILESVSWHDKIMGDEIFGPILPILTFSHIDEVITAIQQKEKPLALYYFGEKHAQKIVNNSSSGSVCVNDTLYHLANPHLPFGGVGHSGIGAYHGKYSFETFSHRKSVLKQTTGFDIPVRYAQSKFPHILKKIFMT